jgi:hypothetical protein
MYNVTLVFYKIPAILDINVYCDKPGYFLGEDRFFHGGVASDITNSIEVLGKEHE